MGPIFRRRMKHIQRYRDIAAAFSRNGFGFIVEDLGLSDLLSWPKRMLFNQDQDIPKKSLGERFRLFLEELGPTFVKVGQIASTRPDLLPAHVIQELVKLQDRVPPFPFDDVKRIIEQELGAEIEDIFKEFRETPLAAASIGQVHYAVLTTGERVAVKVQRPNIQQTIETDLDILQHLAILAERRLDWAAQYQISEIVEEFSKSLLSELDYTIEGRNAEKIAKQFLHDPYVSVPGVFWDYSTSKVLTTEYIEGIKLNEVPNHSEYHPKLAAERFVHAILHQMLIEGFFHADPHPGNILVTPGDRIVFLDFGMVGRLTSEMKYHFASLVISLMRQHTDGIIKAVTSMGLVPDDVNMWRLRSDVDELRLKYIDVPFHQISLAEAVNDLFTVAYRHHIRIPADFTLLGKALLTMEGTAERLDPDLQIIKIAEPFGKRLLKERYHPKYAAGNLLSQLAEYTELISMLPKHVQELAALLKKGKVRMEIAIPELDLFLRKLDRISNRLSFSVVMLAFSIIMVGLIIGSALAGESSVLWNVPAIEIGFGVALMMFIWLLYSIFKSGRF